MQKKRRNVFWYFLAPIVLVWVISFVMQSAAELVYITFQNVQIDKVMENDTLLLEFMSQMTAFLNQYAAEFTTLIAICTLPFLIRMYKKDKREVPEWWDKKRMLSAREIVVVMILAICVCIAANNFILLSGITSRNEAYLETAELIYESPMIVQFLGLGIIVPVMEEMVYRGLLYRRIREYLPMIFSLTGSALLFGIYHGNSVQLIYATVIGVFLAYVFEIFRTVKVSVLFHIVANLTSVICTWTGVFGWIFRNIVNVAALTVVMCMVSAGMVMILKNDNNCYKNIK